MTRCVTPFAVLVFCGVLAAPAWAQEGGPSYTIEDVTACSKDAMRICRDVLADLDAVESCMKAHYDQLNPRCQARFHVTRPATPAAPAAPPQ